MTSLHVTHLTLERLATPDPPTAEAAALALETLSRPTQPALLASSCALEVLRSNIPEQGRGQQLVMLVIAG